MFKNIYCVPTHRELGIENLTGFFNEVNFSNKIMQVECPLIILEDGYNPINKTNLIELNKKFADVNSYYITRNSIVKIYDIIKDKLSTNNIDVFMKLYPNNNINYGNVFNRIFIISLLFGAEYIHRRDSDILIDKDINGIYVYPIENEIKYLSKTIDNKVIYILGGGYKGKYNLDIDSLINGDDYSLIRELFSCMSIPVAHHDEIINNEILGNNKIFKEDNITFDSKDYSECGNISLYNIQRYFPAPTQDFILGSDYFFIDVSVHSKLNVTYHNRAVIHKHTDDRNKEFNKIQTYWKGFLMLIDSQIYYRNFYEKYLSLKNYNYENPCKITNEIAFNMETFLNEFIVDFDEIRKKKYNDCIRILSLSKDDSIRKASLNLKSIEMKTSILDTTITSVKEHIDLIKAWSEIVDLCDTFKDDLVIKKVLSDCKIII